MGLLQSWCFYGPSSTRLQLQVSTSTFADADYTVTMIVNLYKTYVRPYMENCIQAWSVVTAPSEGYSVSWIGSASSAELLLNWFLVYETWVTSIVCRHFVLRLYMTEEFGEILSRRSRYCMVSREYQVISSSSYTHAVTYKRAQHKTSSPAVKTRHKETFLQSTGCPALEWCATVRCTTHFCQFVQETSRQQYKLWDGMGIKGAA